MKLNNKKSYLVAQNEGRAEKRKLPKITQILYILFILFVFIYIIYFFVARSIFIVTEGVVEIDKHRLAASNGGKIEQLFVRQGETFSAGDKLAVIGASKYCKAPAENDQALRLSFDIKDEQIELRGLVRELALINRIHEQNVQTDSTIRRALEINGPLLQASASQDNEDALKKQNEIDMQKLLISNLQERLQLVRQKPLVVNSDPSCFAETIIAPFDGYVFSETFVANEVANRGETIMTVVGNDAVVNVEVVVENDSFDSVQPNSVFKVILPNGYESEATVSEIFSSAISKSERAFKDYSPVLPEIKAHLVPKLEDDIAIWKQYDRFRVRIEGMK